MITYICLSSPTKGHETNSILLVLRWFQEMTWHLSYIRTAWQIPGSAQTLQDLRQLITLWGFFFLRQCESVEHSRCVPCWMVPVLHHPVLGALKRGLFDC